MYEVALTEACFPAQRDTDVREITVGGLLREMAARRAEAEALVEVRQSGEIGRRWTYQALLADSERLAVALASRFRPGERVVVWAPNSPEWVLMEYACALAGLVLVTANPAYQVRELRYVLEQSGPWRCSWSVSSGATRWPRSAPLPPTASPQSARSST